MAAGYLEKSDAIISKCEKIQKHLFPPILLLTTTHVIVIVIMASSLLRKLEYFKWFDNQPPL